MAAKDANQIAREYITKLASKTVSTTLEKIKSKTTKKKESTEKLSTIKAPNGTYYSENDISYLTSSGYTQEEALKELASSDKYKSTQVKQGQAQQEVTEAKQDNSIKTRQAAKELVSKKIDDMLDSTLKKIINNSSISSLNSTAVSKVVATIQSYAGVQITNSAAVTNAISKVETELTKFLNKQSEKLNESSTGTTDGSSDGTNTSSDGSSSTEALSSCTSIQGLNGKIGEILKNSKNIEQIKSTLLSSISTSLQGCTALSDLTKNINLNINTDDIVKNLKINTGDLSKTIAPLLNSIGTTVDNVLKNSKLESTIQQNVDTNFKTSQLIEQSEAATKQYQEQLNNLINTYSQQAATYAQNFTSQLKTALASKVSIKF